MRLAWLFGLFSAVALLAVAVVVDILFFTKKEEDHHSLQQVELLSLDEAAEAKKEEERKKDETEKPEEELATETEKPPDSAEIMRSLDMPTPTDAPALEAASLSAIEQALNGEGGGGDFGDALSFSSGGRINGTGKAGALDESLEAAFSLSEIDQKPRAVFQSAPLYPTEMRGKKVEGVVSVIFVVDANGKVTNPRVEKSTHVAFEKPALEAVKQWKFEPAIKGGRRVGCKMRVPIRFQPS